MYYTFLDSLTVVKDFVHMFMRDCWCLVSKSCPTVCNYMDCSTPGFSILHYLPEFAQIHVHFAGLAHVH